MYYAQENIANCILYTGRNCFKVYGAIFGFWTSSRFDFFFFKLEKVNESSSGEVGKGFLRVHHRGY